jgi:acetolactate decarboxylase
MLDAEADVDMTIDSISKADLEKLVIDKVGSRNLPVLVLFEGDAADITTRSVPAQDKPFPTLAEVVATQQAVFKLGAQKGTLVGFYCPQWMSGLNAPGFHFHFLNDAHTSGGHVLDAQLGKGHLRLQVLTNYQLNLPGQDSAFALSDIDPAGPAAKVKGE